MPLKTILKNIGGTIKTVTEFVEDEVIDRISNEVEYRAKELEQFRADTFGTAEPDSWEMQTSNLVQKAVDASTVGVAEQGAIILGGNTAETVGLPRGVGEFVGGALAPGLAAPAPSAITRATRAATKNSVKTAVKETAEGLKTIGDDLMPPPPAALATAGVSPSFPTLRPNYDGASVNLTPQVMEAASTLPTPTNWQNKARQLYGEQKHRELADTFRRGQGGKLSTKNTFITADELALNKGGVLDQQLERADRMAGLRTKWNKQGKEIKGDRQRELYDAASLNPNVPDIEMYTSDEARKFITKFTNVLSKDQWHHVFGNKEAGEFILSIANSDPLVAANLFKKGGSLRT